MELKKIINIMHDNKFLDYYINMSERFIPGQSSYIIFTENIPFRFIKSDSSNIIRVSEKIEMSKELLNKLADVEVAIFHNLSVNQDNLLNSLPKRTTKIWMFWGSDGYITRKKKDYIGSYTSRLRFENTAKGMLYWLKNISYTDRIISSAGQKHLGMIRSMDYCATWVEQDYLLAKKINPKIKYLYYTYYTEGLMKFPTARKINIRLQSLMLGNSGSEYNNHADALYYLKSINFVGKIYCPLSYSGSNIYRTNIEKLGSDLFGDNFIAMKNFINLKDYQAILNSCDVIWMNHIRQQAAGNIFAALATGKVVILDERNPMLSTLRNWGMKIFSKDILLTKEIDEGGLNLNENIKMILTIEKNKSFFDLLLTKL